MKIVILQSNYIPWKGYFELIKNADIFCFYDEVKYTKNDWRNRNKLFDKNGEFWLSIPISKASVNHKISEVKISDIDWQEKHYNTINQTYYRSSQREILNPLLKDIYLNKTWSSLSELNQFSIKKITEYAGIKTEFVNSADYNLEGDRVERLISLIKQLGGTHYTSGPTALNYLKDYKDLFVENNIQLEFKKYGPYLEYHQNQSPFNNYVSIIDLLMNVERKEIVKYLTSSYDSK